MPNYLRTVLKYLYFVASSLCCSSTGSRAARQAAVLSVCSRWYEVLSAPFLNIGTCSLPESHNEIKTQPGDKRADGGSHYDELAGCGDANTPAGLLLPSNYKTIWSECDCDDAAAGAETEVLLENVKMLMSNERL